MKIEDIEDFESLLSALSLLSPEQVDLDFISRLSDNLKKEDTLNALDDFISTKNVYNEALSGAIKLLYYLDREKLIKNQSKLLKDDDEVIRAGTCYIIGLLKLSELKETLEKNLTHDESPDVRYWAAEALGEIGTFDSLKFLQELDNDLGESERGEYVASAAHFAIEKIKEKFNIL
jgi:HEAT repeat protein